MGIRVTGDVSGVEEALRSLTVAEPRPASSPRVLASSEVILAQIPGLESGEILSAKIGPGVSAPLLQIGTQASPAALPAQLQIGDTLLLKVTDASAQTTQFEILARNGVPTQTTGRSFLEGFLAQELSTLRSALASSPSSGLPNAFEPDLLTRFFPELTGVLNTGEAQAYAKLFSTLSRSVSILGTATAGVRSDPTAELSRLLEVNQASLPQFILDHQNAVHGTEAELRAFISATTQGEDLNGLREILKRTAELLKQLPSTLLDDLHQLDTTLSEAQKQPQIKLSLEKAPPPNGQLIRAAFERIARAAPQLDPEKLRALATALAAPQLNAEQRREPLNKLATLLETRGFAEAVAAFKRLGQTLPTIKPSDAPPPAQTAGPQLPQGPAQDVVRAELLKLAALLEEQPFSAALRKFTTPIALLPSKLLGPTPAASAQASTLSLPVRPQISLNADLLRSISKQLETLRPVDDTITRLKSALEQALLSEATGVEELKSALVKLDLDLVRNQLAPKLELLRSVTDALNDLVDYESGKGALSALKSSLSALLTKLEMIPSRELDPLRDAVRQILSGSEAAAAQPLPASLVLLLKQIEQSSTADPELKAIVAPLRIRLPQLDSISQALSRLESWISKFPQAPQGTREIARELQQQLSELGKQLAAEPRPGARTEELLRAPELSEALKILHEFAPEIAQASEHSLRKFLIELPSAPTLLRSDALLRAAERSDAQKILELILSRMQASPAVVEDEKLLQIISDLRASPARVESMNNALEGLRSWRAAAPSIPRRIEGLVSVLEQQLSVFTAADPSEQIEIDPSQLTRHSESLKQLLVAVKTTLELEVSAGRTLLETVGELRIVLDQPRPETLRLSLESIRDKLQTLFPARSADDLGMALLKLLAPQTAAPDLAAQLRALIGEQKIVITPPDTFGKLAALIGSFADTVQAQEVRPLSASTIDTMRSEVASLLSGAQRAPTLVGTQARALNDRIEAALRAPALSQSVVVQELRRAAQDVIPQVAARDQLLHFVRSVESEISRTEADGETALTRVAGKALEELRETFGGGEQMVRVAVSKGERILLRAIEIQLKLVAGLNEEGLQLESSPSLSSEYSPERTDLGRHAAAGREFSLQGRDFAKNHSTSSQSSDSQRDQTLSALQKRHFTGGESRRGVEEHSTAGSETAARGSTSAPGEQSAAALKDRLPENVLSAIRGYEGIVRGQEMLNQLNPIFQNLGQPAFFLFPLFFQGVFNQVELNYYGPEKQKKPKQRKVDAVSADEERPENKDPRKKRHYARFSLTLPQLGEITVDFSHTLDEAFLQLRSEDAGVVALLENKIADLRAPLAELGLTKFHARAQLDSSPTVRPSWISQILSPASEA